MSLLSDLQLGKGYSGAKDTITKILSPLRHLSGTVGDIGRAAQALKMLPNQIRTKSDMVQVKATLRALNQVLKNSKISDFLNKLENAVGNSIVGVFNPYIDTRTKVHVEYDKNKVVQIVNGIRAARDSRIADQIKNILVNGKDFKDVVKILDRVRENDPKWGLGNILSLLPQNLMAQFAPKFLGAYKTADEFLGISKGIQNLVEGKSWNGGPKAPKVRPSAGVANSTSWNAATNIDKYKADLEAMGLDAANLKTDFDTPIPVDALGAVYEDEIGEDGKPTGKQVVKFKNPFTDETEDLYGNTPTNQQMLTEAIKDINPAPFEGYFRSRLGRLELASTHLWDLQIIPMSPGVPYLSMRDIDVLPITNWSLDAGQTLSDSMEMFGGSSITIPTTKKIDMRFEATFIEDSTFSIKTWLSKYKKFMFHNNRVRPYKDCCSIIGIWLLDVDLKELYYQAYVGYPIDMTEGLEGESSHSPINKTVTFSIVGQLSSKEFYEQIAVKAHNRHWDRTKMNTRYVTNFDRSKVVQMLKESDISKAYSKLKRKYEKTKQGLTQNHQNITEEKAESATPSKKDAKPKNMDGKITKGKASTKKKITPKVKPKKKK